MPTQPCTPPASLALWAATLLAGAGLLVVVALALAPLELRSWRIRGFGALRLLGALLAIGLAGWSLLLCSRVQAAYDFLASRYATDAYYCFGPPLGLHDIYSVWQRQTAALIAPLQRQALITTSATIAFVLVVVALIMLRWLRGGRQARPATALAAGEANARPRWRLGRGRALALLLLFALIVASLGEFTLIQVRSVQAQMAPCATPMSAAEVQQVEGMGIALIPSRDTVPVSAQAALATSEQNLGASLPTNSACTVTQLDFVNASSIVEVHRFSIVWVVGYRIPGAVASPGVLATPPSEEWTFVDAQSGAYLYGLFISSVGG